MDREAIPSQAHDRRGMVHAFVIGLMTLTALSLALRLWNLGEESLFVDELRQVSHYGAPPSRIVLGAAQQGQPPLDYLIGGALHRLGLAGSDAWVRVPAALFGAASVVAMGFLCARAMGPRVGLLAAAMLAVCPLHVAMSQEARPYTILLFLMLVTLLAYLRARDANTSGRWAAFGAAFVLMLMCRWDWPNFVAMGLVIHAAMAWLLSRRGDSNERQGESRRLVFLGTTIALAYAIYSPVFALICHETGGAVQWESPGSLIVSRAVFDLREAFAAVVFGYTERTYSALSGPMWALWAVGTAAIVGAGIAITRLFSGRGENRESIALLTAVLIPLPIVYALVYATISVADAKPQYFLPMTIPLCSMAALGISAIARSAAQRSRAVGAVTSIALISVMLAPMARASWTTVATLDKRDWRGALSLIGREADPDSAFAMIGADTVPSSLRLAIPNRVRYVGRSLPITLIEEPLDNHVFDTKSWLNEATRVWILVHKDRFATGIDQVTIPAAPPPHEGVIHDFRGVFVVELRGRGSGFDRFMDALDWLYEELPPGRSLVAPALLRARWLAAQGRERQAAEWFDIARNQCGPGDDPASLVARERLGPGGCRFGDLSVSNESATAPILRDASIEPGDRRPPSAPHP